MLVEAFHLMPQMAIFDEKTNPLHVLRTGKEKVYHMKLWYRPQCQAVARDIELMYLNQDV